ncbi:TspO/MBR family protein [Mycolicibacterium pulveris]|uniref:TspO/MBR family protein n=1 Tax=Mycolicibacterium pulveris TaxID=36813 RepID=UPI003CED9F64
MRIKTIGAAAAAVTTTALVGGAATGSNSQSLWYRRLRKPPYQPPSSVFPIVWPLLYTDIAMVSARALDDSRTAGDDSPRKALAAALSINLLLNASWSWIFFSRRRLGLAAVTAAALTASSADLTRRATAASGRSALSLTPYPAWCAFATALSTHIWWLNRRR